ncbi:hypothetical protein [Mycobacterium parmense]|uniref:hypothetical protein n=1 Tax=Mycobacterium parmense TaxID=185642 RepID=UPI0013D7CE4D|nr:hypothetical protein [Mycobacterium parmense]MCV7352387.1 hypothetical protein [Mycobacterium parmense]
MTTTDSFCIVAGREFLGPGDDYHVRAMVERYLHSLQGTGALPMQYDPRNSIAQPTAN